MNIAVELRMKVGGGGVFKSSFSTCRYCLRPASSLDEAKGVEHGVRVVCVGALERRQHAPVLHTQLTQVRDDHEEAREQP